MTGERVVYPLRSSGPALEPVARRRGYTEPDLTLPQHAAVLAGAALAAAAVNRPATKLEYFSFLADVPGEGNRVLSSDKRAAFFRVLLQTRWWSGPPLLRTAAGYGASLAAFLSLRAALAPLLESEVARGFAAGAVTGVGAAAVCHPHDVLRATADAMRGGPRPMRGPLDVLWRAVRERPAVLRGLYKGVAAAAAARGLQYAAQFGVYNALRRDGVYRHELVLFIYCHLGVFAGLALRYPVLALRQQLHELNLRTLGAGRRHGYLALLRDMRRRHGLSKVYDGFFVTRPGLRAIPPALFLTLYDMGARRYTEYLSPQRRQPPDSAQAVTSVPAPQPVPAEAYEFRPAAPQRK